MGEEIKALKPRKEKKDTLNHIKIRTIIYQKAPLRGKSQPTEKAFTRHAFGKGLVQINKKNPIYPDNSKKWENDLDRYYAEEDSHVASKQMKTWLISPTGQCNTLHM